MSGDEDLSMKEVLKKGSWAEHKDGSLVNVTRIDDNIEVYFDLYNLNEGHSPAVFSSVLPIDTFETIFTYDPSVIDKANLKWNWYHEGSKISWDAIRSHLGKPVDGVERKPSAALKTAEVLELYPVILDDAMLDQKEEDSNQPDQEEPPIVLETDPTDPDDPVLTDPADPEPIIMPEDKEEELAKKQQYKMMIIALGLIAVFVIAVLVYLNNR